MPIFKPVESVLGRAICSNPIAVYPFADSGLILGDQVFKNNKFLATREKEIPLKKFCF